MATVSAALASAAAAALASFFWGGILVKLASPRQIGLTPHRRPLPSCFCSSHALSLCSLLALLLPASRCCPAADLARCSHCRRCRRRRPVPQTCRPRWWALPSLFLILLLPLCLGSRSYAPPARSPRPCLFPLLPLLLPVYLRCRFSAPPHRPLPRPLSHFPRRAGGLALAASVSVRVPPASAASPRRRSSRAAPSSVGPGSATGRPPAYDALSPPGVGQPTLPPPVCVGAGASPPRPAPGGPPSLTRCRFRCAASPPPFAMALPPLFWRALSPASCMPPGAGGSPLSLLPAAAWSASIACWSPDEAGAASAPSPVRGISCHCRPVRPRLRHDILLQQRPTQRKACQAAPPRPPPLAQTPLGFRLRYQLFHLLRLSLRARWLSSKHPKPGGLC